LEREKRQNPARHDRVNLYRKRYLWSVVVVALPDILRHGWRSRILGRNGSFCRVLATYATDVCLWILGLFLNTAWNNVDLFADIQRKRKTDQTTNHRRQSVIARAEKLVRAYSNRLSVSKTFCLFFCSVFCGFRCRVSNFMDSRQFVLDIIGSDAFTGNHFSKLKHVDHISVERTHRHGSSRLFVNGTGRLNVLFPVLKGSLKWQADVNV
jgi:hypothetical protein